MGKSHLIACPSQEILGNQPSSIFLPWESRISIVLVRVQLQMTESILASHSSKGFAEYHWIAFRFSVGLKEQAVH